MVEETQGKVWPGLIHQCKLLQLTASVFSSGGNRIIVRIVCVTRFEYSLKIKCFVKNFSVELFTFSRRFLKMT